MATRRKQPRERDLTARPKSRNDVPHPSRAVEHGLSVDPEQLGTQFLNEATDQGNFEASRSELEDMTLAEAGSDEPLSASDFEPNDDVWENTVHAVVEADDSDALREPALPEDDEGDGAVDEADEGHDVDLTRSNVQEASLFDRESDTLGEVEEAQPQTEGSGVRAVVRPFRGAGGSPDRKPAR